MNQQGPLLLEGEGMDGYGVATMLKGAYNQPTRLR